jgi:hypothetical protein
MFQHFLFSHPQPLVEEARIKPGERKRQVILPKVFPPFHSYSSSSFLFKSLKKKE